MKLNLQTQNLLLSIFIHNIQTIGNMLSWEEAFTDKVINAFPTGDALTKALSEIYEGATEEEVDLITQQMSLSTRIDPDRVLLFQKRAERWFESYFARVLDNENYH